MDEPPLIFMFLEHSQLTCRVTLLQGELRKLRPHSEVVFYNDFPLEEGKQIVASLLCQSQASLVTESHYAPCDLKIPKTYVVCSQDKCIPPPGQRLMAQAAGAKAIEFDCGHSPHAKDAESAELVKLIMDMSSRQDVCFGIS
jgi:hypothetical protein